MRSKARITAIGTYVSEKKLTNFLLCIKHSHKVSVIARNEEIKKRQ
ncbi:MULTISPECIES: hypothetical protein [unclassified Bacillus (in: firmicutes)]|nr:MULTISPECIES: hypothetical protein [unclassified Bacillus (in: firmicutes)]SFI38675.1 hypothetical protein SAMN04488574_102533 [Bacillus sp. 71mf]SFT11082.1 hypothetical protein SAMN04488145_11175 [Bacillus sp. 103mf]